MIPWKIIGTVAGGAFSIAAAAGLTMLVRGAIIWGVEQIENNVINQVQAEADKWKLVVRDVKDAAKIKHDKEIEGYKEKSVADKEQMAEMARTIQLQLDQNPLSVDASIARELYRVMCQIKAGRDLDARQACDLSAAQADLARYSSVVSVNAARIEEWDTLCQATGSDDYCKPRVIGFAPGTMVQLIGWMRDVDTSRMTDDANYDTIVSQINQILALPEPTVKEK